MRIELKILNKQFYSTNRLPSFATDGSAGIDLVSTETFVLHPGERVKISTGVSIHINDNNTMGVIVPRSGLGTRGLVLANTVGIIDSDYQGEIIVSAFNCKGATSIEAAEDLQYCDTEQALHRAVNNSIRISAGDRIAQIIFVPVIRAEFSVVEEFSNTTGRAIGGFGSTGA